jgi:hypothetical protein
MPPLCHHRKEVAPAPLSPHMARNSSHEDSFALRSMCQRSLSPKNALKREGAVPRQPPLLEASSTAGDIARFGTPRWFFSGRRE